MWMEMWVGWIDIKDGRSFIQIYVLRNLQKFKLLYSLRRVCEKYLIVFAMSTPEGTGIWEYSSLRWKSCRPRSFAWTGWRKKTDGIRFVLME